MKLRLALNWLVAILTVPGSDAGDSRVCRRTDRHDRLYHSQLMVAGVLCGYALLGALIGWMERNERRVEADPYAHKGSNYREV